MDGGRASIRMALAGSHTPARFYSNFLVHAHTIPTQFCKDILYHPVRYISLPRVQARPQQRLFC